MSYAQIEITEVGPAEYPLMAVLRDTIFGEYRHRYATTFAEGIEGRQDVLALMAHRTLKLRDFSRVDFRLGADGVPYCLEANTLPGVTRTSLFPQSAAAVGIDFASLCQTICDLALRRARFRNNVRA